PASSLPLVEAGQVRALASTSDRRSSQMPDVPTMIEAGVADFTSVSFTGVVAPTGTPDAIVNRLNADINASLQSPEVASALVRLGVDAKISSPPAIGGYCGGFFGLSSKRAGVSGVTPPRWRASVSLPVSSQSPVAARRANVSQRSVQSPRP